VRREGEGWRCGVLGFALMESARCLFGVSRVVFLFFSFLFFSLGGCITELAEFEGCFCERVWEKHA
jgi:hypothetical protein